MSVYLRESDGYYLVEFYTYFRVNFAEHKVLVRGVFFIMKRAARRAVKEEDNTRQNESGVVLVWDPIKYVDAKARFL